MEVLLSVIEMRNLNLIRMIYSRENIISRNDFRFIACATLTGDINILEFLFDSIQYRKQKIEALYFDSHVSLKIAVYNGYYRIVLFLCNMYRNLSDINITEVDGILHNQYEVIRIAEDRNFFNIKNLLTYRLEEYRIKQKSNRHGKYDTLRHRIALEL